SNGAFSANTQENALLYDLSIANIKSGGITIPKTQINGKIEDNMVDYVVNIKDLEDKERYNIAGIFRSVNGTSEISFDPQEFLLNYEKWNIKNDNLISIQSNGVLVNN